MDSSNIAQMFQYISSTKFNKFIKLSSVDYSIQKVVEAEILLLDRHQLLQLMDFLKCDPKLQFAVLIDICGVDYLDAEKRFEIVYHLLSIKHNARLRIKLPTDENEKTVSVAKIFRSAVWYEREVYDMFGLEFEENPDMRRILTDYNFSHFPLRKDFPLSGYTEVHYNLDEKQVTQRPTTLPQAYRSFDFSMPWSGMQEQINDTEPSLPAAQCDNKK